MEIEKSFLNSSGDFHIYIDFQYLYYVILPLLFRNRTFPATKAPKPIATIPHFT